MAGKPFTPETVYDSLAAFEAGMNSGNAPLLLPKNQLFFATNSTVRGSYVTHRPPFTKHTLDFGGDAALQAAVVGGLWQGGCYYKPDSGVERLVASISGRLFLFSPTGSTWTVTDVSIPGDTDDPTVTQAWLWQAEKWVIRTDGTPKPPVFFDGTTSRRSLGNSQVAYTIASVDASTPNFPDLNGILIATMAGAAIPVGTSVWGQVIGTYTVIAAASPVYTLQRTSTTGVVPGTPFAPTYVNSTAFAVYSELPAGRMGAYGLGRVWMALIDGKQFVAGDIVGGPSGTLANNYRDAVLKTTENAYLNGGGYFSTPGAWGDIRAMIFASTLDASLGQGPLQVMTPTRCFSCQAPTDRDLWATMTNPILTESLIANGSESHYGTVNANGDILMRAVDGIRSLILGRRDFATWGNVPISSEMDRVLSLDVQDLLRYSSAILFENRLLMTAGPAAVPNHGVFHNGIIALNFDPISNLRGKAPSVYDGLWTGLNVLQLIVGRFSATERAFAFTYNQGLQQIELYEILTTPGDVFGETTLPTDAEIYDNGVTPIVWSIESPMLFKAGAGAMQDFFNLLDGELSIDNLVGSVDFSVYYKPDQYPCWVPWFAWSECAKKDADNSRPQFRPRMGLGEPPATPCDPSTNRRLREGFSFQIKLIVQGHCRLLGARFKAVTLPISTFAKQGCARPCSDFVIQ